MASMFYHHKSTTIDTLNKLRTYVLVYKLYMRYENRTKLQIVNYITTLVKS